MKRRGLSPTDAGGPQTPNLDPAQVSGSRDTGLTFGQGFKGAVGSMVEGVPLAGPYLQSAGQKASAAKQALTGGPPYRQALENIATEQEIFNREHPGIRATGRGAGGTLGGMVLGGPVGAAVQRAPGLIGAAAREWPRWTGVAGNPSEQLWRGGAFGGAVEAADAAIRGEDPMTAGIVGAGAQGLPAALPKLVTPFPGDPDRIAHAANLRKRHK